MSLSNEDERIWSSFRERSLQPGGFGEDRARIWPALLGAQPLSDPPPYSEVDSTNERGIVMEESLVADPHADERQIKLDTDRSFVLYPGDSGATPTRDTLQNDLHELLVSLFRRRRSLHYFQGFHDIMTVIFLTLPRPLHLACAEKIALHRVRDSMGAGLEPVLGLLRVLRNLLRLADPAYAKLLEDVSPLPYHALSHLLTLFSHDVPTLPLIQHVWDFLLSREPLAVVWLAAALILHRKPSIYLLAEQDEEGMVHSLLGGIPELVDAESEFYGTSNDESTVIEADRASENQTSPVESAPDFPHFTEQTLVRSAALTGDKNDLDRNHVPSDVVQNGGALRADSSSPSAKLVPLPDENCVGSQLDSTLKLAASIPLPDSRPSSPIPSPGPSPVQPSIPLPQEATFIDYHNPSSSSSCHAQPRSRSSSDLRCPSPSQSPSTATEPSLRFDKPRLGKSRARPPPLSLTHLLRQADDLLAAYPPSHPSLRVSEIMGPDSAMRTWRPLSLNAKARNATPEKQPYDYSDDYLETLATSSCIVIPSPPPSPPPGSCLPVKKTKASPRTLSKILLDPRRIGQHLGALTPAERRVLFMGALFVVGVAMAVKSGKVSCADGVVKTNAGDGLKRLWNGKWALLSSVVAAWGRGLP